MGRTSQDIWTRCREMRTTARIHHSAKSCNCWLQWSTVLTFSASSPTWTNYSKCEFSPWILCYVAGAQPKLSSKSQGQLRVKCPNNLTLLCFVYSFLYFFYLSSFYISFFPFDLFSFIFVSFLQVSFFVALLSFGSLFFVFILGGRFSLLLIVSSLAYFSSFLCFYFLQVFLPFCLLPFGISFSLSFMLFSSVRFFFSSCTCFRFCHLSLSPAVSVSLLFGLKQIETHYSHISESWPRSRNSL